MRQRVLSILALLLVAATGAWADTVVLGTPETSVTTLSDENGIITLSDASGSTGIQQGSSSYKISYGDKQYIPMKLSGSRNFTLSFKAGVTINKVTLMAMSNGDAGGTAGGGDGDATSLGNFPARNTNGNCLSVDITNKTGLRFSRQAVAIIVVEYSTTSTVAVTGINLDKTSAEMTVGGDALTLTATVAPDNATDKTVTWTTSDANVATVTDGVVTAKAAGTATITATATNGTDDTSDDKTATCEVTVTDLRHTLADGSYYVKNGALSLYMAAGGSWGTQGLVNERGLDLIFTYNSGTKTYTIDSNIYSSNNHFLNPSLYMDSSSWGWTVEGVNSFTISAILDGVKHYIAVDQNNNLVFTQDGTAENAQWIIIPKADHENAVLAAGLNALKAATAENGVDATFLIACPGFNRGDKRNTEAWTVEGNNLEMGSGNSDGNGCSGGFNSTFTLSQTLSNAPAGVYTLTAQGFYKQNGSDNENLPYFYANDEKQTFKLLEDQVYNTAGAGPVFTQGKYTIDPITVVVAEDGALTIGAKLETNTYNMLSCWDNFKLTYYGPLMYDLTLADSSNEHGTVAFTVGGNAAEKAEKDDVVTVSVTPNEGYSAKDVTVRAYTSWEDASEILTGGGENPGLVSDITVTKNETDGTWQFTMPEFNVWIVVTYAKNVQDAWIQNIADQTYTGSAIEPTVTVMDGETTLVLNTDYTVAYSNNTEVGEATVTVTGMGNYCGTATTTFYIRADKTALNNAITEAEAYYNSISESNPDAAAALQTAINAAKGVQDNADATQSEVETAAQTLNEAVDAAKADVALKRVTLTIPAKSYMARIDADKQQIENAVEGVKLYSVKNVTDSQVELTAELNVIAAEMPYLIYNDNDTEVEVSIVVSSEDADNVDYDSEHFKGTLVDKTFTDEDIQAADHYVLTNGSNFVWVKDAGTLSAGKCWIQLEKSLNNARALSIVHEGETTGISEEFFAEQSGKAERRVKSEKFATAPVYDLQGRRVAQPAKGIYVKNGRKVIVRSATK